MRQRMGIWRICVWPTLGNQGGYHGYYGEGWFFAVGGSERQSVCVCRGEGGWGIGFLFSWSTGHGKILLCLLWTLALHTCTLPAGSTCAQFCSSTLTSSSSPGGILLNLLFYASLRRCHLHSKSQSWHSTWHPAGVNIYLTTEKSRDVSWKIYKLKKLSVHR